MPLHSYACPNCGHVEEVLFSAARLVVENWPCRVCDALAARQFPTGTSFGMKGFSAKNGYTSPDERFHPHPKFPGIKTKVTSQ